MVTCHQLHCLQDSSVGFHRDQLVLLKICLSVKHTHITELSITCLRLEFLYGSDSGCGADRNQNIVRAGTSSVMMSPTLVDLEDRPCTMIFRR